ncbi:MAG: NAD-dependent epimerase/dehydratase family protein [Gemmatimonadetes bacterium]|jgi:2'-hydroxyisoflavone reductase|nr:NAD-dependent epimerase/dehydratase family protein [Gemmatimonadota bacterium]MBT6144091.1 NAD-dependent epimerase/dehydratase family protein [Gemmatimonadota bacterium]MBT7863535.1 NAD-dependent epimerase/dehydratase family protein [Gemmatimonadota bacterium]
MNILLIGGTRYFGRCAVEQLLGAGHKVSIFSRGNVRPPFWNDIEHIKGDREDAAGMVQVLAGREFDGVIDNQCYEREEALSVIEALRGRVGRYVVASTVSVYGEGGHASGRHTLRAPLTDEERFAVDYRPLEPVRETDLDNANHPWEYRENLSEYGEGKRHVERVMLESPDDWPWITVRVPATLGPLDPSGRFAWWLTRIQDGNPILLPDGGAHATQVGFSEDLARFLIRLLEDGPTRNIYNYAQRELPTLANWLQVIADAAGKPLNTVAVPSAILQQATELPWEDWSYAPFSYCPLIMSTAKAEADIGLDFRTSLQEWVQKTVDSYADNPDELSAAKHGDHRPAEVTFASRWTNAQESLTNSLTG